MKTIEEGTYCYYSSVPIQRDAHLRHGKDVFHSEQARPTPRGLTLSVSNRRESTNGRTPHAEIQENPDEPISIRRIQ